MERNLDREVECVKQFLLGMKKKDPWKKEHSERWGTTQEWEEKITSAANSGFTQGPRGEEGEWLMVKKPCSLEKDWAEDLFIERYKGYV